MRRPDLCDLDAAARVLLARPRADWACVARSLVEEAHLSDRIRKRLHRAGPGRGTGTLAAEAMRRPRAAPSGPCDPVYCAALSEVLQALDAWRGDPRRRALSPSCN